MGHVLDARIINQTAIFCAAQSSFQPKALPSPDVCIVIHDIADDEVENLKLAVYNEHFGNNTISYP